MTRRQAITWMTAAAIAPLGCRQPSESRPTIRLANWGGAGDDSDFYRLVQDVYHGFEQEFGIRLRVEGTPNPQDYVSKILLDYVAGSMPDVMALDASSAAVFINNGTLLDLGPFIAQDRFKMEDFYPNVVEIASRLRASGQNQAIYAIPNDFTPMVMYCNKKLFKKAGVALPEGRWTFDEFLTKAIALTSGDQFGFEFANWMPGWVMFLWNNGADALSPNGSKSSGFLDSKKSVEAVKFLADLVLKHKASPDLSQAASTGVDYFATGRAAMKVVGHWYLIGLQASKDIDMADIAVVELPTNLPQSVTVMYESGYSIGAKCKHPDLAWNFLKYFSSERVQARYNSSGIAVCARKDVSQSRFIESTFYLGMTKEQIHRAALEQSARNARHQAFEKIIPSARAPWGATVEGYDRVEDIGQKAMDAILKNRVPVKQALTKAATEIDGEFAKR